MLFSLRLRLYLLLMEVGYWAIPSSPWTTFSSWARTKSFQVISHPFFYGGPLEMEFVPDDILLIFASLRTFRQPPPLPLIRSVDELPARPVQLLAASSPTRASPRYNFYLSSRSTVSPLSSFSLTLT